MQTFKIMLKFIVDGNVVPFISSNETFYIARYNLWKVCFKMENVVFKFVLNKKPTICGFSFRSWYFRFPLFVSDTYYDQHWTSKWYKTHARNKAVTQTILTFLIMFSCSSLFSSLPFYITAWGQERPRTGGWNAQIHQRNDTRRLRHGTPRGS